MNFNKVFLAGRLTRDPEMRYTKDGTPVCGFGMAINRKFGKGDDKREEVTFVDVTAWQRTAEIVCEYCLKGKELFVEGRLKLDTWEDRDGKKQFKLSVVAEAVQLMGGKGEKAEPHEPPQSEPPPVSDNIPF